MCIVSACIWGIVKLTKIVLFLHEIYMNKNNVDYGSCLCHIKSVQPEVIVLTCFALQMVLKSAVHKHRLAIVID